MSNKTIVSMALFGLLMFSCFRFASEDNEIGQAELIHAGLKNFKNRTFNNQPPWLEYHIVIRNQAGHPLVIMGNEGYVFLRSAGGEVVDSFKLSSHPIVVEPLEIDTVRIVELFLEKREDVDLSIWLEPDMQYKNWHRYNLDSLLKSGLNIGVEGAVETLNTFEITKSKDFAFSIE